MFIQQFFQDCIFSRSFFRWERIYWRFEREPPFSRMCLS